MRVTAVLTRHANQLSLGRQMNDIPAASGSRSGDLELQQLALAIKQSPKRTDRVVRKQIARLLTEISVRLQPAKQALIKKWSGIINIESIVAEAVSNALIEAVKNLDRYDPERASVMTWINGILKYRFQDALRGHRERHKSISIENSDSQAEAKIQSQIDKDSPIVAESETAYMADALRRFINSDPEGHLAKSQIRNNANATFKAILLMRIEGLGWQEIADLLNIDTHSTVSSFHDRQLRKLTDYFRKYLSKHLCG
jgi:RNA polymerase sigma factor (sigma-70 family)